MTTELVKIDHKEFGLEDKTAELVSQAFIPMLQKMEGLESEFNEIVTKQVNDETCKEARALRLEYVKVRTGVAKIHKAEKQKYIAGGKYVDGWKNAQLMASNGKEEKLKEIEEHFERIENEKLEKIANERISELEKLGISVYPSDLGLMELEVWENYLTGMKLNCKIRKEAEEQAEQERIAKIKADNERIEAIKKENEELKKKKEKEAEEHKKSLAKLRLQYEKEEKERNAKAKAQAKIEAEKKAKYDAIIESERKESERVKKELEDLRTAKELEAKRQYEEEQAELGKDDTAKLTDLINSLNSIKNNFNFKSQKNRKAFTKIQALINEAFEIIELETK